MDLAVEGKNPCPSKTWDIPLKLRQYDVQCFRDRLAQNFDDLYVNMPRLRDEVHGMTDAERATWNQTLEYAAKNTGYNEDPITAFDVSSYAGLPHYAEAVMLRFDKNHDGALDRSETLKDVFPIFKRELGTLSGIKIDFLNKAVLLYLMQKGEQPKILDLLGWALGLEFLDNFHARRIRIYQIFAALTPPAPPDPTSETPPPGIYPPPAGSLTGGSPLASVAENLVRGLTPVVTEIPPVSRASTFDIDSVDPVQMQGYAPGPIIDPASPYQEALDVLPQDL
jgi:hypothetical protein